MFDLIQVCCFQSPQFVFGFVSYFLSFFFFFFFFLASNFHLTLVMQFPSAIAVINNEVTNTNYSYFVSNIKFPITFSSSDAILLTIYELSIALSCYFIVTHCVCINGL